MKIKTVAKTIQTLVSEETGEVLDVSVKKVNIVLSKDKFALVYVSMWDAIIDSSLSRSDIELFAYLVSNYGDGTPFTINSYIKQEVSKRAGKNITSYNKSTRKLLDGGFILQKTLRNYIINPVYVFEGSSNTRKKLILELVEAKELKI